MTDEEVIIVQLRGDVIYWKNQTDEARAQLAARDKRIAELEAALRKIANRSDHEMRTARTLHYDMRGWALAALTDCGGAS